MARIDLNKFAGIKGDENLEIEGFTLEFEPDELPALMKAAMPVVSMFKSMAEEHNSKEWEKLCDQLNEANEKLRETQAENRGITTKLEAKTMGFDRLLEEKKALKEEIENRNTEIAKLREELFKARLPHEKLDPNSSGCRDDIPAKNPWGID